MKLGFKFVGESSIRELRDASNHPLIIILYSLVDLPISTLPRSMARISRGEKDLNQDKCIILRPLVMQTYFYFKMFRIVFCKVWRL